MSRFLLLLWKCIFLAIFMLQIQCENLGNHSLDTVIRVKRLQLPGNSTTPATVVPGGTVNQSTISQNSTASTNGSSIVTQPVTVATVPFGNTVTKEATTVTANHTTVDQRATVVAGVPVTQSTVSQNSTALTNGSSTVTQPVTSASLASDATIIPESTVTQPTVADTVATVVPGGPVTQSTVPDTVTTVTAQQTIVTQPKVPEPSTTWTDSSSSSTEVTAPGTVPDTVATTEEPLITVVPNPATPTNPPVIETTQKSNIPKSTTPSGPQAEALKATGKNAAEKLKETEFKNKVFAFELTTSFVLVVASIGAYVASFLAYKYAKKVTSLENKKKKKLQRSKRTKRAKKKQ
ncbi:hypothetical protein L3Y34_000374 [Caenorhabditis briggsae]|uniref:Uncharacterized protein n=1 Tax=Caenorhabditis briggsae TaxID=6238 RepID=A0AAE9D988_CAEBR|nr:hypothetical protein L3Y34_000374 [Caenorhabditis briggsae]